MSREVICTQNAAKPPAAYSQAVKAAGLVFVSGTTPLDPVSGAIVGQTIQEQTRQCLTNISAILEAAASPRLDRFMERMFARSLCLLTSRVGVLVLASALGLISATRASAAPDTMKEQVWAAEVAFARSMKERNLPAFGEMIADEAVFFSGTTALRGKSAVTDAWSPFFVGPDAPFSWEPDQVEVLESGTLALSTGPVRDPSGHVIARFNSIWRLEAAGRWRVVFDKGSPASPGPK